jgi:biopolymer transport protein ExbB
MAAPATTEAGDFGLMNALNEGGVISWSVFVILVIMSVGTFYIMFTKFLQQQKIIKQGDKVRASFWNAPNLRDASSKLETKSAYRAVVEDALVAQDQHSKLTDPVDQHEWVAGSLNRSQGAIGARLGEGLAFLATVGSTAPFIGLFGTVVGIYRALIKIGASGDASITTVAGPVGEALIMTALGLVVAVPAVLAYNWLIRRNKTIMEDLGAFTNDVHGYLASAGAVKPSMATGTAAAARGATTSTATQRGQEPLRAGQTQTGAAAGPNTTTTPR